MRLATLSTFALLGSLSLPSLAADPAALAREGAALIPPFAGQLLETVQSAIQEGGPTRAVEACQLLAPQITDQHSQSPWQIGRTALKVRNSANAPDAWERQVLEQFAARAAAGEPLSEIRHAEIVDGQFRLMKAIPTGEACLACHGSAIKPELAAVIDQRYPDDQARGFALGDLRGAFSLRRTLD